MAYLISRGRVVVHDPIPWIYSADIYSCTKCMGIPGVTHDRTTDCPHGDTADLKSESSFDSHFDRPLMCLA